MALDTFTTAYLECALWSSYDNADEAGGEPMDANYSIGDLAPGTLAQLAADCADFQTSQAELLAAWYDTCGESPQRAGYDFWLTRNRHGAGFWDRWSGGAEGRIGRALTDAAHVYGSCDLYIGDDGKLYAQ